MASDCKTLFVTFTFNSLKCKRACTAELSIYGWGWSGWHNKACLSEGQTRPVCVCQSSGVKNVFVTAVFTLSVGNGKPAAITILLHYAPTSTGKRALRDGELGHKVDGRTDLMLSVFNF